MADIIRLRKKKKLCMRLRKGKIEAKKKEKARVNQQPAPKQEI
jgi:hypothetical protein